MNTVIIAALAYLIPTFVIAYTWHLRIFAPRYAALGMYRDDVMPALGLSSMAVQAVIFGLIYQTMIAPLGGSVLLKGAAYAALGFLLSWSFSTLAVAGKSRMTSVQDFVVIETAFTAVQWIVVGFLTAALV
jgi:hypothetical protein